MIQILDQFTIDKIAAGEVIERPGSVIKELVENSIDAGATAITVEIKDGGLSFIRITDNGCGIAKEEVPVAFLRHATSKLQTADDLLKIASLGFRGEALSSIAAVAQVEMITKQAQALTGTRYQIHGGNEISIEEIGAPVGTTIVVRNLFYNTPARKKFMKTPATEGSYIYDLVCRIAMSHPEISFQFIMNSADKLFTSGNGKLKDIIYHIYGRDITNNLLEIDAKNENVHITGYLAKPSISRGNRAFEDYYVNRRYIKSNILTKAIEDAYRTFVMVHKFPFTVLNFEINPALIDVNIHPAKRELKFMNEPDIYDFTYISVRKALLFKELIPEVTPGKDARPQTLASRKLERKPEPFEANRRAAETTGQNEPIQPVTNTSIPVQTPSIQQDVVMAVQTETTRQNEPIKSMPTVSTPIQNQDTVLSAQNEQIKQDAPMSAQKESVHQEPIPEIVRDCMQTYQAANPVSTDMPTSTQKESMRQDAVSSVQSEQIRQDVPKKETYQQLDMFEHKFLDSEARKKHRIIGRFFKPTG